MTRTKIEITDKTFKKWIDGFKKQKTKSAYATGLRTFKKNLGIEDLGEYLESNPDTIEDLKKFSVSIEDKASLTIRQYITSVRVFFMDHDIKIDENGWNKAKKRGFIQRVARPQTRDKIPSKEQMKSILNYVDVKGKALFLFLVSSGARVGESLKLELSDFDLEANPPTVFIRKELTKFGIGERTVHFSYEAKEAIKDWLRIKDGMKKRDGTSYKNEIVFFFSYNTAVGMWNRAIKNARLDKKDKNHHVLHIHSLRKFFRSKIGLTLDQIHVLMGHSEYLDNAYLRQDSEEIAEDYLSHMGNVSVHQIDEHELKRQIEPIQKELTDLKKKYDQLKDMYEAGTNLWKQLDRTELEKFIRGIMADAKRG